MFVDDCIIFYKATKRAAWTIKQFLDHYCSILGQFISYHKSKVQFLRNVSTIDKKEVVQILQVTPIRNIEKFLGCSNIDSPRRIARDFNDLKRKSNQKLAGRQAHAL